MAKKKVQAHPDVAKLRKAFGDELPPDLFDDRVLNHRVRELAGCVEAGEYPPDLVSLNRVRAILGMSHPTVCRMVRDGRLRAFQIAGGPRRYSESEARSLVTVVAPEETTHAAR